MFLSFAGDQSVCLDYWFKDCNSQRVHQQTFVLSKQDTNPLSAQYM